MASFLILLVLINLCIFSVSADVSVSIDCGSSGDYTDDNLISWTTDDSYINSGENQMVQRSDSRSHVMDTLRVFRTRMKNCYSIQSSKGTRVLVRASFYYGNYDQKSSPPIFDLQFDGNHWVTVNTSSTDYFYYEIIYVTKKDYISVCLAQTQPNQFPFISALEVRELKSYMYSNIDENFPLFLERRKAYGANATIRYSDDPYDRIWTPARAGSGLIDVAGDAILSDLSGFADNPPPAVLRNAVTGTGSPSTINLNIGFPSTEVPIYMNFYFSEVTELGANEKRSFKVYKDNKPYSLSVSPPYGNYTELYSNNTLVSSNTTFSLVPDANSTLSPLINAMELFLVGDALTDGTNSRDVEGLALLQNAFDELEGWSGDPCLPAPYTWDWISCSGDAPPRVTALYLDSFNLSGTLPNFSSMDALETIDLHNNSLYGTIPDFLGSFPKLKELNLGNNQFTGSIPASLAKKNGLKLEVTGNPDLCPSGTSCGSSDNGKPPADASGSKKKKSKLPVILGATIPSFVLLWVIGGVCLVLQQRRKAAAVASLTAGANGGAEMAGNLGRGAVNELKSMEEQVHTDIANPRANKNVHQERDLY